MMNFDDDFDFIPHDVKYINNDDKDPFNFDFPICHSTPSLARIKPSLRSVDYPSLKQHYGLVTFFDYQLPIIYRLINDTCYIPYIRFSYVLNIFEHSYKNFLVNIRNLPVLEMTSTERMYYDRLSPSTNNNSDWSNGQLLSVSLLDSALAIISLTEYFHDKRNSSSTERCDQWQEAMNIVRQEARDRWILDEKIVLTRLVEKKDTDSTCISSTSIAKRRALVEQRLDLAIVDEVGGFVQIDSYVYPFVKNPLDNQIYINLDDIRQNHTPLPSYLISYSDQNSAMHRAYNIVIEQAQTNYEWNIIRHGRNNDLSKFLPTTKSLEGNSCEELPFLPLQTLLTLFLTKDSHVNLQFVQLFETSSLDEIESNYKNNVARQFIITSKRQGGFIHNNIPCLIFSQLDRRIIWLPIEMKTQRIMHNDERCYLNILLLYHGLWKKLLTKKKQWYLKEIDDHEKENIQVEILFNMDKSRRNEMD